MAQQLRICYRAEFEQPIGVLNPLGVKVAVAIGVELRKSAKGFWQAWAPGTRVLFQHVTAQPDAGALKNQMHLFFKKRLTDWRIYELDAETLAVKVLGDGDIYTDREGRTYRKEIAK